MKRRRRTGSRRPETAPVRPAGHGTGVGQLAALTVAIVLGVAGLAFALFWIAALVVMGILWGTMAAERRRQTGGSTGVIAEVVDVVVSEAKDVAGSGGSAAGPSTQQTDES